MKSRAAGVNNASYEANNDASLYSNDAGGTVYTNGTVHIHAQPDAGRRSPGPCVLKAAGSLSGRPSRAACGRDCSRPRAGHALATRWPSAGYVLAMC